MAKHYLECCGGDGRHVGGCDGAGIPTATAREQKRTTQIAKEGNAFRGRQFSNNLEAISRFRRRHPEGKVFATEPMSRDLPSGLKSVRNPSGGYKVVDDEEWFRRNGR